MKLVGINKNLKQQVQNLNAHVDKTLVDNNADNNKKLLEAWEEINRLKI